MTLMSVVWCELKRWRNRKVCARRGHIPAGLYTYPPLCPRCHGWPQ